MRDNTACPPMLLAYVRHGMQKRSHSLWTQTPMNLSLDANAAHTNRCQHRGPLQHPHRPVTLRQVRNHPRQRRILRGLPQYLCRPPRIRL